MPMTEDLAGPAAHGFGLFGHDFGYPPGGLCLSVFLFAWRHGKVLVGRMDEAEIDTWTSQWAPNIAYYEGDRRAALVSGLRFPATYLREGEDVQAAARRIWNEQLGWDQAPRLAAPRILSEAGPSRRTPGASHWDLLFLFDVEGREPTRSSLWREQAYRRPEDLHLDAMGSLHGELIAHLRPRQP